MSAFRLALCERTEALLYEVCLDLRSAQRFGKGPGFRIQAVILSDAAARARAPENAGPPGNPQGGRQNAREREPVLMDSEQDQDKRYAEFGNGPEVSG